MKELYRFVEGSLVWTSTSSDKDEVYNSETYTSKAIGRNEVESKNELSRSNIEISVSIDDEMGRRWLKNVVDSVVTLTIFSKEGSSVSVVWKGRLSAVKPEISEIVLVFESIFTSLRRPGLRARYQRSCPHVLYGRGCNLNKDDWAVSGIVTNVQSTAVVMPIAATYPDGYFTAGIIEAPNGTLRFITGHSGQNLTLIRQLDDLSESFANSEYDFNYGNFYGGISARIFPGCDRVKETCNSKFSNLPNFGGFPFIPLRNPFDGSSIV